MIFILYVSCQWLIIMEASAVVRFLFWRVLERQRNGIVIC